MGDKNTNILSQYDSALLTVLLNKTKQLGYFLLRKNKRVDINSAFLGGKDYLYTTFWFYPEFFDDSTDNHPILFFTLSTYQTKESPNGDFYIEIRKCAKGSPSKKNLSDAIKKVLLENGYQITYENTQRAEFSSQPLSGNILSDLERFVSYIEKAKLLLDNIPELKEHKLGQEKFEDRLNSYYERSKISVNSINDIKSPPSNDVQHPLNAILYGPPGTGKTYKTKDQAVSILIGHNPEDHDEKEIDSEFSPSKSFISELLDKLRVQSNDYIGRLNFGGSTHGIGAGKTEPYLWVKNSNEVGYGIQVLKEGTVVIFLQPWTYWKNLEKDLNHVKYLKERQDEIQAVLGLKFLKDTSSYPSKGWVNDNISFKFADSYKDIDSDQKNRLIEKLKALDSYVSKIDS